MVEDYPDMKECFTNPPMVAYKRHKNLRDMLIRAKLPPKRGPKRKSKGFKHCNELCKMCPYTPNNTATTHTSQHASTAKDAATIFEKCNQKLMTPCDEQ